MAAKEILLKAETRNEVGTKCAAKLRSQKKIPAIVYGHKQQPTAIAIDQHAFAEGLHHGHRLFDVDIDGKTEKLLIKSVQHDYLGSTIIHADFLRVDLSEKVKVEVPVNYKGVPAGKQEGGILESHLDKLEVECAVVEIPATIDVSVKAMKVGESIFAKDVVLPAGVKLLTNPETLLIACFVPVAAPAEEAAETGEEPTSPEVITERKPKEGEEESEDKK
ncbi:MAG: 50S ribosomal protein L25 [Sedimentisphaerales bacterium]